MRTYCTPTFNILFVRMYVCMYVCMYVGKESIYMEATDRRTQAQQP